MERIIGNKVAPLSNEYKKQYTNFEGDPVALSPIYDETPYTNITYNLGYSIKPGHRNKSSVLRPTLNLLSNKYTPSNESKIKWEDIGKIDDKYRNNVNFNVIRDFLHFAGIYNSGMFLMAMDPKKAKEYDKKSYEKLKSENWDRDVIRNYMKKNMQEARNKGVFAYETGKEDEIIDNVINFATKRKAYSSIINNNPILKDALKQTELSNHFYGKKHPKVKKDKNNFQLIIDAIIKNIKGE